MGRFIHASTWLGGGLAALVFSAALAADAPTGYRSAEFGMSSEEVMAVLERDAVTQVEAQETEAGDLIIDGELLAQDEPETDLRYVFPAGSDQLALVVSFHPDVAQRERIVEQLVASHGEPWAEEMSAWWYEQLQGDMPETPQSLMVWGGEGDEATQRGRFVRLWTFEDYLSVEYLDTQRFR
ncbi:hypothetical protein ACOJCM_19125 [Billgrantia sp. LNSP4103-1]|uniref:hypothetical protein n=1 Tax=Billgrantia sp. LNSP4103-1 TaxID=3410266 RepID=UPI00403FA4D7